MWGVMGLGMVVGGGVCRWRGREGGRRGGWRSCRGIGLEMEGLGLEEVGLGERGVSVAGADSLLGMVVNTALRL